MSGEEWLAASGRSPVTDTEAETEAVRAARVLRDQIVDGQRLPGARLVERELAAELGMSRLPVREALKDLVAEGLVTPRPRSWAVVREFTPDDVRDLIEVRSAFEVLAFERAAARATPEGVAQLRAVVRAERAASERDDAVAARRAGVEFHAAVDRLSGNRLLLEIGATLSSRMRWMLSQHQNLGGMAAEHEGLLSAIEAGDVERAGALARAHLRTSLDQIARTLRGEITG